MDFLSEEGLINPIIAYIDRENNPSAEIRL